MCKPVEYYRVPIEWREQGAVYIEASSPEEAIQKVVKNSYGARYGRTIRGSVKVVGEVISDREYRGDRGPKLHLITGMNRASNIEYVIRQLKEKPAESSITSNIPELNTTEEFDNRRLGMLLEPMIQNDVFLGEELIAEKNHLYMLNSEGVDFSRNLINILEALVRKGDILVLNNNIPQNEYRSLAIIYNLLWHYIHLFNEVYLITQDNSSYSDYEEVVNTTFHYIEDNGTDTILDLDTFDEKLMRVEWQVSESYQKPTHRNDTHPNNVLQAKKDKWYRTPNARAIPFQLLEAIERATSYYYSRAEQPKQQIEFSLYTTEFEVGTIQVIEHQAQEEDYKINTLYFIPDRSGIWEGKVKVIRDGFSKVMITT